MHVLLMLLNIGRTTYHHCTGRESRRSICYGNQLLGKTMRRAIAGTRRFACRPGGVSAGKQEEEGVGNYHSSDHEITRIHSPSPYYIANTRPMSSGYLGFSEPQQEESNLYAHKEPWGVCRGHGCPPFWLGAGPR